MSVDRANPMIDMGQTMHRLAELLRDKQITDVLGTGLTAELTYSIAAFRSRFRGLMPDAQQDLFSAAEAASATPPAS